MTGFLSDYTKILTPSGTKEQAREQCQNWRARANACRYAMAWTMKKKFFLRVSFLEQGLDRAQADLLAGKHRHDVLEEAIRALELDPADDSVGRGGFPNVLGKMELDAAFMDGDTRNLGAVAGVGVAAAALRKYTVTTPENRSVA
jgi:Asparaginase